MFISPSTVKRIPALDQVAVLEPSARANEIPCWNFVLSTIQSVIFPLLSILGVCGSPTPSQR
ncbi:hypothetical protein [Spiroplasma sp. ChiS]|uniref:hypothetical protein n=1 Tax=Spiroplasma sp. ChiS TaxID=2099885 RepID=UPI0018F77755|nr:hypothetical protein [Spiroplasma sp. ChiS]